MGNNKEEELYKLLIGGDLRSIGQANVIVQLVHDQKTFDALFQFIYNKDRLIVMRAADAIEKITRIQPNFLTNYTKAVIELSSISKDKELKWHLAQIASRLILNKEEQQILFSILKKWVKNQTESKIVRVNSLQTLFEMSKNNNLIRLEFDEIIKELKKENAASINARIKKLGLH